MLRCLVRRPTGSFSWGPAQFLRFTFEWRSRSVRAATRIRDFRRREIDSSVTTRSIWKKNCFRDWDESESRLFLRMDVPPMFASVSLCRRENAPTPPPSDDRKSLRPKTPGHLTARALPTPHQTQACRSDPALSSLGLAGLRWETSE